MRRFLRFSFRRVKSPPDPLGSLPGSNDGSSLTFPACVVIPDGSKLQKEHAMASNVYVGNLTFNTTSADLQALFGEHGEVKKAQVITDRETGRSRGFGFVEMATSEAAEAAISSLNGREVDGRALTVNLAKERAR
ncbi:MAG TPA: RNA-binding protein [Acidimicrobiia bacterium]|nr:RNA-binding protein [Acidimicrobiia bacterium]